MEVDHLSSDDIGNDPLQVASSEAEPDWINEASIACSIQVEYGQLDFAEAERARELP